MSLVLYSVFVFVQTVRHRDYFLPVGSAAEEHAPPSTPRRRRRRSSASPSP
jgi:Ca2+:H+ antiporter